MAAAKMTVVGDYRSGNLRKEAQADLNFLDRQAKGFSSSIMKSFGGVGAALGGMFAAGAVVDFFKQSAEAAMEDEKSMVALARAMDNVGLSAENAKAEGLIQSMMLQTGIADDQLRPAYQKLVTVTKDVTEAQGLLQTALDLSAAGYGDLESASKALSAAANGNFTALQRLKVPIDQAALSSKDFDAAVASLNKTVGGQAAAAAQTFSGQMNRITVAAGEAKEAIGYALLNALDDLVNKLGGTGGVQQALLGFGNYLAQIITDMGKVTSAAAYVGVEFGKLTGFFSSNSKAAEILNSILKFGLMPVLAQVGQTIENMGIIWNRMPNWMKTAADATLGFSGATIVARAGAQGLATANTGLTSATVQAALASGSAKEPIKSLTGNMYDLADGADAAAESMAKTVMAANALALEHEHLGLKERVTGKTTLERYKATLELRDILNATTSSSRGAASATDQLTEAQQRAADRAQKLKDDTASLESAMRSLLQEISPAMASAVSATFESVNAQIDAFKAAFQEARTYAQGIVSTFMGQLDLGAALDQAKATGTTIIEAFTKQGEKVQEFGKKMNELLNAGLSRAAFDDIMRLGYQRGMEVATALTDGNVAGNVASVNKVYGSVKTMAEQVAEAAKTAFYQAGLDLILSTVRAMVESLGVGGKGRKQLMSLMDELSAAMSRNATITLGVVTTGGGASGGSSATPATMAPAVPVVSTEDWFSSMYPGVPLFSDGGIAMSATPGIFGESGPEALIPLDRMGDFGGNNYSITVNAGVGDPRAIGRSVVEAITSFERSSGPVFARA